MLFFTGGAGGSFGLSVDCDGACACPLQGSGTHNLERQAVFDKENYPRSLVGNAL